MDKSLDLHIKVHENVVSEKIIEIFKMDKSYNSHIKLYQNETCSKIADKAKAKLGYH